MIMRHQNHESLSFPVWLLDPAIVTEFIRALFSVRIAVMHFLQTCLECPFPVNFSLGKTRWQCQQ